ncbi:MAG TPA: AbrB family transcriptional regulator [Rhizobiaceae bacterium]|nr:AbrB family transcriptional regulator [Rhizobiaceae bacterium]
MPENTDTTSAARLAGMSPTLQWAIIFAVSAVVGYALQRAGLPAALLLGPMVGGIVAGANGATVRVPRLPYLAAQGVIGVLVAQALTLEIMLVILDDWLLFAALVLATIVASSLLGYLISRWRILPGSTAVWGSSPGAATAMVIMAEAFGADARLVAFMQYLRVICVAAVAAVVARLFVDTSGTEMPALVWFPAIEPVPFASTVALVVIGGFVGVKLKIPAGAVMMPMLIGSVLHIAGLVSFQLPEWLLAASYALIGWNIGLGFTRGIILHAARALPQIIASIVLLIAFCWGLAFILSSTLGIDMLTAYLATSPGGMDSIAIIAAASPQVDLPLIMALQTVRFLFVLFLGPSIARLVARQVVT